MPLVIPTTTPWRAMAGATEGFTRLEVTGDGQLHRKGDSVVSPFPSLDELCNLHGHTFWVGLGTIPWGPLPKVGEHGGVPISTLGDKERLQETLGVHGRVVAVKSRPLYYLFVYS